MHTASTSLSTSVGLSWCLTLIGGLALVGCTQEYEISAGPVDVNPEDILDCGFTPISGTQLSVYDCNPVFSGTDEAWGKSFISVGFRAQEILGHPFFQIWYAARPEGVAEGEWGLGYAISENGTEWITHPNNPLVQEDGGWDRTNIDALQIVWDTQLNEYVLWYQGYALADNPANQTWGMGVKTSPDGAVWQDFNDGEMILDFSKSYNGIRYCWPMGVTHGALEGYSGFIAGAPDSINTDVCQMYRFTGQDLSDTASFKFEAEPLLRAGPETYDTAGHASVAVVKWDDEQYFMFYVGFREWIEGNGYIYSNKHSLNMATSPDANVWTKSPDNPLPINLLQPGVVSDVAAQRVGSRIHLWVTDYYEDLGKEAVGYYIFEPDIEVHP